MTDTDNYTEERASKIKNQEKELQDKQNKRNQKRGKKGKRNSKSNSNGNGRTFSHNPEDYN